jgi:carbonic anhydrase
MSLTQNKINISSNNIFGKCVLKCDYVFKYSLSSCVAKNNSVMIILSYDKTKSSPVTYNNNKYEVSQVALYCPSYHNYDGVQTDAEILVTHAPVLGGSNLIVCVPIVQSGNTTTSSEIITTVINAVSKGSPKQGETTTVNITNYSLENIIPKKSFYTYVNSSGDDYIVFGKEYAIPLTSKTLSQLKNLIKPYNEVAYGDKLFFNSKGPASSVSKNDEIYISCTPTGNSEETVDVEYEKKAPINNDDMYAVLQYLVPCIIFIVTLVLINMLLSTLTAL